MPRERSEATSNEVRGTVTYNKIKHMKDNISNGFVSSLNKSSKESIEISERYEKIYTLERAKWPYDLGNKLRSDISTELQSKLDECIENSQKIAKDACQTVELTEAYLKQNQE